MVPVSLPFRSCRCPLSCGPAAIDSVAKPLRTKAVTPGSVTPLLSTFTRIDPEPEPGPKLPLVAIGLVSSGAPETLAWYSPRVGAMIPVELERTSGT